MRLISMCIMAAWSLGMCTAVAQDIPELQTDRPDETESSSVVPSRALQIEAGLNYTSDSFVALADVSGSRTFADPSVLVRYGLLEWLELRVTGEHTLESAKLVDGGTSESRSLFAWGIGTKVQILREAGAVPEMALILDMGSVSGGELTIPGFRLSMSHTLAPTVGFGYNVGGEFDIDAPGFSQSFVGLYTAALGVDFTDSFGGYAEIFGSIGDGFAEHSVDAGVTYALAPNLQIDAALGAGISEDAPDYYLNTGISVRLPE